jgi:transmembrane sensor
MNGNDIHELWESGLPDEVIARWLSGDLSEAELADLEEQVGKESLDKLRQVVEAARSFAPPAFDAEASWGRLEAELGDELSEALAQESGDEAVVREFDPRPPRPAAKKPSLWPVWTAVAAAAIIAAVLFFRPGGTDPATGMIVVTADAGTGRQVNLPDGSEVDLRQGATLSYPEEGWTASRKVELSGEAYFKVAKGASFKVETPNGSVQVLGTRFSVRTGEGSLEVGCYSGKVRVEDKGGSQTATITPGQSVSLQGAKFSRGTVAGTQPEWAVRELVFDGTDLAEVLASIELEFDVEITCFACEGKRYSGSFSNRDIREALSAVTLPFGLGFEKAEAGRYEIK